MSNLGWPVKVVAKGGIPVTEAANGLGTPCVEADNGVAVTFVESGGYPLTTGRRTLNAFMSGLTRGICIDYRGAFYQEPHGPTIASTGDGIGLAFDVRTWMGRTLAEELEALPELIGNGQDITTTDGWTGDGTVTLSAVSGRLRVTNGLSGDYGYAYQALSVSLGDLLAVADTAENETSSSDYSYHIGSASVGDDILSNVAGDGSLRFGTATEPTAYFKPLSNSNVAASYRDHGPMSAKALKSSPARQAAGNRKPTPSAHGVHFDGIDDVHLVSYRPDGDANFFLDYVDIPSTIAATQALFGAVSAGGAGFYVAITSTGAVRCRVGSTTLDTTGIDVRGGAHFIAAWTVAGIAYILVDGVLVASSPWAGSVPAMDIMLGALSNAGVPSAFFGGSLYRPLIASGAMSFPRARSIMATYLTLHGA